MRKNVFVALIVMTSIFTACGSSGKSPDESMSQVLENDIYLTLVNKEHRLPDDWNNRIELCEAVNSLGEEFMVERKTLESFEALRAELLDEGIDIELDSTYRSVKEQKEIWAEWTKEYGEDYCNKYLAVPGYSEHHTGLAIDIFIMRDGVPIRENDEMLADVEDFVEIHRLLPKYGFILRYPEYKEDITGYNYEPWHLRYVGRPMSEDITIRGETLEEFLLDEQ